MLSHMLAAVMILFAADANEEAARAVLAALVRAARANHASAAPKKGAELTALLTRAAAVAAAERPEARRVPAFLLALGVGLDRSSLMRLNPVTAPAWRRIETDAERKERLKVLGTPELHGREDLAQHFAVSCALAAMLGPKAAEAAGVLKEMLDAQPGGSGFSFADLAADFSGVAFAEWLKEKPGRLAGVKALEPFCLGPAGWKEGLSAEAFERMYGGAKDARFLAECRKLRERIAALKAYR